MLVKSIEAMGYQLEPSEVAWLAQRIGRGQDVRRSTLAAAHIDWPALLQDHRHAHLSLELLHTALVGCRTTGRHSSAWSSCGLLWRSDRRAVWCCVCLLRSC